MMIVLRLNALTVMSLLLNKTNSRSVIYFTAYKDVEIMYRDLMLRLSYIFCINDVRITSSTGASRYIHLIKSVDFFFVFCFFYSYHNIAQHYEYTRITLYTTCEIVRHTPRIPNALLIYTYSAKLYSTY
jgi:hypothetical protein